MIEIFHYSLHPNGKPFKTTKRSLVACISQWLVCCRSNSWKELF